MAEHSMCQPGRPGPISVSQNGLARLGSLPEGEVVDAFLFVFVGVAAGPRPEVLEIDLGEPAVGGERVDGEIDRPVLLVGEALLEERLDESDHLRDVSRRPRVVVGRQDGQGVAVPAEGLDERLRVLVEAHALGLGPADRLVVDVRDVHDVRRPGSP